MLEAFALDALDLDEEESVQDHLDACGQCSEAVDRYQETAATLAGSVAIHEPPPGLRASLMQAISREEPATAAGPGPLLVPLMGNGAAGGEEAGGGLFDSRLVRIFAPMTASVAMVLVVLAVTMNVRISGQVDDLKRENASLQANVDSNSATVTAQLNASAQAGSDVIESVLKLQQASFEMAQPDNRSLALRSPTTGSASQGILLVSSDGSRGVIMVTGLEPPDPATDYQVWLMRGRDKVWAGTIGVDSRGSGTVMLQLPESIMGFEKVELTATRNDSASQPQTNMVLEGDLVSMVTQTAPRMVTYSPWR
ncbi:MAG: anti-sigma factor [Chloroflexi bacterium]|nr:anti-sigma factor [Chloroflexota bacterium]MDA1270602.1 anti-sigma factor [Chloroflexota bacterium]